MSKRMNPNLNSIHHTNETSSYSEMVAINGKKCHKRRHRNQCSLSKIFIKADNLRNANDLIKPCSVILTKLNLLAQNGNNLPNSVAFPEISISKKLVTSIKFDKFEHGYSIAEKKGQNSSERNGDSVKNKMDLLYERLCETFRLLKAKKKKEKLAKKVKNGGSFPFYAEKQGMTNSSTGLINNFNQAKNQITKTRIPNIASKHKTKDNKKSKKALNKNKKNRKIKKYAALKNLKRAAKNGKELFNKNSKCMLNLNLKSSGKDDITLVKNSKIQLLEHERNLNKAIKKYPANKRALTTKENFHRGKNIKCMENVYSKSNKEYNNVPSISRDESNNVLQMEIMNKQETECCISFADHSISSSAMDKISNRSIISEFTRSDDKAFKYLGKTLSIKPCSVVIDKLPIDQTMKFIDPTLMKSLSHKNASCSIIRDGNYNLEAKYVSRSGKGFCSASSTKVGENLNANDDDSAINYTVEVGERPINDVVSAIDEISDVDDDVSSIDEIPDTDDDYLDFVDAPIISECIACSRRPLPNVPPIDPNVRPNLLTCFILVGDIKHKLSAEEYSKYFIPLRKRAKKEERLKRREFKRIQRQRQLIERYQFVREWLYKNEEIAKECEKDFQMNEI